MRWKQLSSETLLDNRYVKVQKDCVELSGGVIIDDFYKVTISDCSAIIALTEDLQIILKKEYRHCYKEELIEFPAGTFEPEETDSLAVAKRELWEETGYVSEEWEYLGATVESSAKLTNHMHIYLAKNCHLVSDQHLDRTEDIEVITVSFEKAVDMVMKNEICCNSTAHAVLKVARLLGI